MSTFSCRLYEFYMVDEKCASNGVSEVEKFRTVLTMLLLLVRVIELFQTGQYTQYFHKLWQSRPPSCTFLCRIFFENIGFLEFFVQPETARKIGQFHMFITFWCLAYSFLFIRLIPTARKWVRFTFSGSWIFVEPLISWVRLIQTAGDSGQLHHSMTLDGRFYEKPLIYEVKLIQPERKTGF